MIKHSFLHQSPLPTEKRGLSYNLRSFLVMMKFFWVLALVILALAVLGFFMLSKATFSNFSLMFYNLENSGKINKTLIASYTENNRELTIYHITAEQSIIPETLQITEAADNQSQQILQLSLSTGWWADAAFLANTDRILANPKQALETTIQEQLGAQWQAIMNGGSIGNRIVSAKKWYWLLRVYLTVHKISSDQIAVHTYEGWDEWQQSITKPGLRIPSQHAITPVEAHKCAVAVVNTTQQAGLASSLTQVFERVGYIVIRVTDSEDMYDHSQVVQGSAEDCGSVAKALAGFLHLPSSAISTDQTTADQYRANIVIFVGADIATKVLLQ